MNFVLGISDETEGWTDAMEDRWVGGWMDGRMNGIVFVLT